MDIINRSERFVFGGLEFIISEFKTMHTFTTI